MKKWWLFFLLFSLTANSIIAQDSLDPIPDSTRDIFVAEEKEPDFWDDPIVEKIYYKYDYYKRIYAHWIPTVLVVYSVLAIISIILAFKRK